MHPDKARRYKVRQSNKQTAWRVRINGKGSTVIFPQAISYLQAIDYFKGRYPGYLIEVGV